MSILGTSVRSDIRLKAKIKKISRAARVVFGQRVVRVLIVVGYLLVTVGLPLYQSNNAQAATITHRSTATAANNSATSLTITKPTGTASGDVLILVIGVDNQNQTGFIVPNDWTHIRHSNNGTSVTADSYYKVAGDSEPADYTVSWSGTTRAAGSISAYSGVDLITPIEVIGANSTANGNSITVTGITTLSDNSVVVAVLGGSNNGATSFGIPTGMAERAEVNSTTGTSDITTAIFDQTQATAGATGNKSSTAGGGIPKAGHLFAMRPALDSPTLMLYWDGASPPAGWSFVTRFDGLYPRGETVANFGITSVTGAHTPTLSSLTVATNGGVINNSGGGTSIAVNNHTHPAPSVAIGTASNSDQPLHRTLKLIRYDAGIPAFIPAGGIAMFDDTGIPASGWTAQSTFHGRMLKINTSDTACMSTDCGADTHTHSLPWSGLDASSGTTNRTTFLASNVGAGPGHTHGAPTASNTVSVTTLPPHVQPLLGKATTDTSAVPAGLLGMFDKTPGSGWVVRSNVGGTFNQQFLRAAASFNGTSQGAVSHTHATVNATTGSSQQIVGTLNLASGIASPANHTHTYTAVFNSSENMPDYFNTVIAEKINFILSDYRWYEDSDSEDVTDPWGRTDVAQNAVITTVPPRNDPPAPDAELRLRIRITVSGQDLPPNDIAFRLQFKAATDQSCSTSAWTDVGAAGSGSIWRFADSSVSHGTELTTSRLSPSSGVLQTYNKANPTGNNPNPAIVGEGVEYDFHIQHNGANNATMYSFRLIENSGPLLAEYAVCPTLVTKAGTENQLRHGNVFESETERGFTWAD